MLLPPFYRWEHGGTDKLLKEKPTALSLGWSMDLDLWGSRCGAKNSSVDISLDNIQFVLQKECGMTSRTGYRTGSQVSWVIFSALSMTYCGTLSNLPLRRLKLVEQITSMKNWDGGGDYRLRYKKKPQITGLSL